MSQVHQLYRLQEIDNEIREKKQRLREVLRLQKQDQELQAARQHQTTAESELAQVSQRQKELEHELSQVSNKVKRSEDRLYSGKVTNTKELTDLQQEIAALGRRRATLEDEILETMLLVEKAQEEEEQTTETLDEVEEAWDEQVSKLAEEQNELAVRLNELLALRKEQAQQIDSKMLSIYEATGSRRSGVAVARLKDDSCQACGVRSSDSKVRAVRGGDLVYCGSCGRILASI